MGLAGQADLILQCFPSLTKSDKDAILEQWAQGVYEVGQETSALSDLQRLALDHLGLSIKVDAATLLGDN